MRYIGLFVFLFALTAANPASAAQALVKRLNHSEYANKNLADGKFDRDIYNDAKSLARFGDRNAQYTLGAMLYLRGEARRAAHWYRKAALFGHPQAALNLGLLYYKGVGVEKDYDQALRWVQVAVDANHPAAQLQMGIMSFHGHGVPASAEKEAYWYKKAAYNGDPDAQYNLAVLHVKGRGVPQDMVMAYTWMLAADNHGIDASSELQLLVENMDDHQVRTAQARFAELKSEIKVKQTS